MKFSIKDFFSKCDKIRRKLNGKLNFFCSESSSYLKPVTIFAKSSYIDFHRILNMPPSQEKKIFFQVLGIIHIYMITFRCHSGCLEYLKSFLLRLRETNNTLQLPVFFFFSFFCQPYSEYRGIRSKNYFTDHLTANTIQLFVHIKRKFFGSILFQDKSQRRGIP